MKTFSLDDAKQYLKDLDAEKVRKEELRKEREEEDRKTVLLHLDFCFQRDGKLLVDTIKHEISKTRNPNRFFILLHGLGSFDKLRNPELQFWNADEQRYMYVHISPSINDSIEAEFEKRFPGYKVSRMARHSSNEYGLSFAAKEERKQ